MTLAHLLLVALVQGITEFLPVSSSAHLVLIPVLAGWTDQGLNIDIAAHLGSLGAVVVYFRQDMYNLVRGVLLALRWRPDAGSRLALLLAVASTPTILVGALLVNLNAGLFRDVEVIAWATLTGAIALLVADRFSLRPRSTKEMSISHALVIGLAQILALIPGASAAGGFSVFEIAARGETALTQAALISAVLASAASYAAITFMMEWLRRASYMPFVIYRVALGTGLLWWVYGSSNLI